MNLHLHPKLRYAIALFTLPFRLIHVTWIYLRECRRERKEHKARSFSP